MPINLLPQKAPEERSFWEEAYRWSLTIGRIVIIGTEAIVLGVFFSRFFLDPKITDLSEEIKTKQVIIKTTGDLEPRFRDFQDRLVAIRKLKEDQHQYSKPLQGFTRRLPTSIALSDLSLKGTTLSITAKTINNDDFTKLLIELLSWDDVLQVALTRASLLPTGTGIEFSLAIEIYPSAYAYQPLTN